MAITNPQDSTEILMGSSGDVRNEFNSFQDPAGGGHYADEVEIPGALIIRSMRVATRLINAFLEPVYPDQMPFTTTAAVPKILDEIAIDMSVYFVMRSSRAKLGNVTQEKKQEYYDVYMDPKEGMLYMMSSRKMLIPELVTANPVQAKSIRNRNRPPVFDIDKPENWKPSDLLIQDIERDRD